MSVFHTAGLTGQPDADEGPTSEGMLIIIVFFNNKRGTQMITKQRWMGAGRCGPSAAGRETASYGARFPRTGDPRQFASFRFDRVDGAQG